MPYKLSCTVLPIAAMLSSMAVPALAEPAAQPIEATTAPPGSAAAGTTTIVPRDLPIVVKTRTSESSYSARTGAKIRYVVAQDVVVDGHVVAKAGDTAEGQVQEGQSGEAQGLFGGGFKEASLRISVDSVYSFCGDTLHVDFDRTESRRRQGAFGENKDVHVTKGQLYVATTDRPQRVCSETTTAAPEPIPTDALRSNDQ